MTVPDEQWAADLLYGTERSAAPATAPAAEDGSSIPDPRLDNDSPTVDLDTRAADGPSRDVNAGAKKSLLVLGGALVAGLAVIVAVLTGDGDPPPAPPAPTPTPAALPVPAPVPPTSPARDDRAVPFTASANCPAGSTSAQALSATDAESAWVCVRGAAGAQVDGQVLHVDFGRSYALAAVTVTPGWVGTGGGLDHWLQHRVVTRLQYLFDDDDRTILTQDTGAVHGPVTIALPHKVLASRVTVLILATARPPAAPPAPPGDPTAAPGFVDSVLGTGAGPAPPEATATTAPEVAGDTGGDPVDATFAMSALIFLGHQPD